LIQIPAPGTENDDHNPPRIASRSLFDLAVGHDNLFHGEKYKWSAPLTAINLTNMPFTISSRRSAARITSHPAR